MKRIVFVGSALAAGVLVARPGLAQRPPLPRIAVYGFDSAGLDNWWGVAGFDPGDAISDVLTDKLVDTNAFNVIDRDHLQQVLNEQNLSQSGAVSPATEAQLGRLLGVDYLVFGRVIQFDRTGNNGGGLGGVTRGLLGGVGVSSERVTLHVSARIVETNSGRIVQTVDENDSKSGTSFSLGGANWGSGGVGAASYRSSTFTSSTVGQLVTTSAENMALKIDATKLVAGAPVAVISAKVLDVDGNSVIINAGANSHVAVGTYFTVYEVRSFKDPDSGKMLVSHSKRGSLQIVSVDTQTATGKLVEGAAKTGETVMTGP